MLFCNSAVVFCLGFETSYEKYKSNCTVCYCKDKYRYKLAVVELRELVYRMEVM